MGAVSYKYRFDTHLSPSVEEIANRFRALTGLALSYRGHGEWDLSASPLSGSVELSYPNTALNTLRIIPWRERFWFGGYFFAALSQALHELGARQPVWRGRQVRRWEDLRSWRQWIVR